MNSTSRRDTTRSTASLQFTNYDVLLLPPSPCNEAAVQFAPCNHIGNNRFNVFLDLYRERFIRAEMMGDRIECNSIAFEVIETITKTCVPRGRIFELCWGGQWQELGSQQASRMTHNALRTPPIESSSSSSPSSANRLNPLEAHSIIDFRRSQVRYDDAPPAKRFCRRASDFTSSQTAMMPMPNTSVDFVLSPSMFDVLCKAGGREYLKSICHVGNNRLKVLIDLRMKSYAVANANGRLMIASEVAGSIIDETCGRFLQEEKGTGGWTHMSLEAALICVSNALHEATVAHNTERTKLYASAVQNLRSRRHKKAVLDKIADRKRDVFFDKFTPPVSFNHGIGGPSKQKEVMPRAA